MKLKFFGFGGEGVHVQNFTMYIHHCLWLMTAYTIHTISSAYLKYPQSALGELAQLDRDYVYYGKTRFRQCGRYALKIV